MKPILKSVLALLTSLLLVLSIAALSPGFARASNAVPKTSGNLPGVIGGYAYAGYLKVPSGLGERPGYRPDHI